MKMMHGEFFFAFSNISRTRDAPTPTNISTKSEPEIVKNGTFASPAIARASKVLPVPGGPTMSTPRGIRPPSFWNLVGSRKNSTISVTSSLASSQPATSANVVVLLVSSNWRALLFPKENGPPPLPPPCIWRIKKIQTPINNIIGNHETKMLINNDCSSSGLASTVTLFFNKSETNQGSEGAKVLNFLPSCVVPCNTRPSICTLSI